MIRYASDRLTRRAEAISSQPMKSQAVMLPRACDEHRRPTGGGICEMVCGFQTETAASIGHPRYTTRTRASLLVQGTRLGVVQDIRLQGAFRLLILPPHVFMPSRRRIVTREG